MRIVALVPGGISEQLLFFPTLDALKHRYPNADIDVVVEPRAISAYRVSKSVNDTITFDFKDNNSPADWANLLGVLRDRDYSAALSTGGGWGMGLLLWLAGMPTRVGFESSLSTFFATQTVPLKREQYIAEMYHDLLQGFDITTPCPELAISIPRRDLDWASTEQTHLGISGGGYVLIYDGADSETYPPERWGTIIQDFRQKQPNLPLVIVRSADNAELVGSLVQAVPELKVTAPPDLGKLAAMIAGANLMLCTASAPMHLAVGLKVYTLALFGSTKSAQLLPASDKFLGIQSASGKLADIDPKTVLQKVWGG